MPKSEQTLNCVKMWQIPKPGSYVFGHWKTLRKRNALSAGPFWEPFSMKNAFKSLCILKVCIVNVCTEHYIMHLKCVAFKMFCIVKSCIVDVCIQLKCGENVCGVKSAL